MSKFGECSRKCRHNKLFIELILNQFQSRTIWRWQKKMWTFGTEFAARNSATKVVKRNRSKIEKWQTTYNFDKFNFVSGPPSFIFVNIFIELPNIHLFRQMLHTTHPYSTVIIAPHTRLDHLFPHSAFDVILHLFERMAQKTISQFLMTVFRSHGLFFL